MDRKEIVNSQDYKAQGIALDWWRRNGYDIRDGVVDVIDAYQEGVIYGWNNPQWIPVEEELPEKENEFEDYSKLVIVTNGKEFWKGMYNYGGEDWLTFDLWPIDDATHWMEIQLPRKEAKNETNHV